LIGKTVRVKEPKLIQFFYPSFEVKSSLDYLDADKDIIYVGKGRPNVKKYLNENTNRFINTVGMHDIDLTTREGVLDYVYSSRNRKVPQRLKDILDVLSDEDFEYGYKVFWISGVWPYVADSRENTIYQLFKSSLASVKEMMNVYFNLVDNYPFYIVESSFITFLNRVIYVEEQKVNNDYKKLLKNFSSRQGKLIRPSILNYAQSKVDREELRFLNLLLDLKGSGRL